MTAAAWVGFLVGIVVVLVTAASVLTTMVVPRAARSRLSRWLGITLRRLFYLVVVRIDGYEGRDRVLAMLGPAFLVTLLATWMMLVFVGYSLLLLPWSGPSLTEAMRLSGSSMFTLGFVVPQDAAPTVLVFLAAASGLVIVALLIAYLPALYSAFNRRETLVTMLDARGGSPAWGPEVLARQELVDVVDSLGQFYERWQEWAADLAETHTNYPTLVFFRSPHPYRSWIIALLAVLDAAALHHALNPLSSPSQARLVLRQGITSLRDIATVLRIPFDADPHPEDPIALTREEFDTGVAHLEASGWSMERGPDDAWTNFRGWRVNYESISYAIADRVVAPPALWSGPRRYLQEAARSPLRPPHREPDQADERDLLRRATAKRRAARPRRPDW
ncbi:MAG: hypothetical protein E6J14_07510 [Chloroflexi bacterium]|nr:MAG: hypothetical protein E6J14_07510 [Chloroflexota bacterium]